MATRQALPKDPWRLAVRGGLALSLVVGLCGAAAPPANKAPPYKSLAGETLFRQMLLGWCLKSLAGDSPVANSINPLTWPKLNIEAGSNELKLSPDARINRPSRTIVDLIDGTSCFVEGGELDSAGLTTRLRKEIQAPPLSGEILSESDSPEARTSLFSLPAGPSGPAPVIILYEYKAPAPGVVTAVVKIK